MFNLFKKQKPVENSNTDNNQGKSLLFIATHVMNKGIISEYKKLCNTCKDKYDVILLLDNTKFNFKSPSPVCNRIFYGIEIKCFLFDENIHDFLNLPYHHVEKEGNFGQVMWCNADYRFYYVRKFFPNYKYYWQFDWDCFCNGDSYAPFLKKYENNSSDLLIALLRNEEHRSEWCWTHQVNWIYGDNINLYGSLFPVCRLSANAIDYLYEKRLEHAKLFKSFLNDPDARWIFCELFVPTELGLNEKFTMAGIENEYIRFRPVFDLNTERLYEEPDFHIYHPVKGASC
ncbi:MAG: hypothetical protein OSJ27_06735 [Candidatus Gastranaerophilales bacterium]|nr:hypothetical protein [Candidatus Gastranaerophilales bacterium]